MSVQIQVHPRPTVTSGHRPARRMRTDLLMRWKRRVRVVIWPARHNFEGGAALLTVDDTAMSIVTRTQWIVVDTDAIDRLYANEAGHILAFKDGSNFYLNVRNARKLERMFADVSINMG